MVLLTALVGIFKARPAKLGEAVLDGSVVTWGTSKTGDDNAFSRDKHMAPTCLTNFKALVRQGLAELPDVLPIHGGAP